MKKLSLIVLALLAVLVSCKKAPEVNLKYVDVEREVLTIGTTTATFQCDYQYIATLKSAKVYYGLSESGMSSKEMQVVSSSLYAEITGLEHSTTYNYYYEFDNGYNMMQSGIKSFVTETSATVVLPTIITADVTEITAESAVSGGNVTNDGGGTVTERGVCWSTSANPTINDSFTTDGEGIGSFISNMTGLSSNTTYHVRAYATNEAGTAYGLDKEFATLNGGGSGDVPEGAINGLFTINENGDKVYFSQGNLQYQASTNTWRFAEHQWDFVGTQVPDPQGFWGGTVLGSDNNGISSTYGGWIDLFGWGTSGWNNGNVYYQPYDTVFTVVDGSFGFGYGPTDGTNYQNNLTGMYANADWGVCNAISNGGNELGIWRVLTRDEWVYMINTRSSDIRYAKAVVNGVNGFILLPDSWDNSFSTLNSPNNPSEPYSINEISLENWETIEASGAIFLPAAGGRYGRNNIHKVGDFGVYWSTTSDGNPYAYNMHFHSYELYSSNFSQRYLGFSVRLVKDANNK